MNAGTTARYCQNSAGLQCKLKERRRTQQKFKIQAWQDSELQHSAPKMRHRKREQKTDRREEGKTYIFSMLEIF